MLYKVIFEVAFPSLFLLIYFTFCVQSFQYTLSPCYLLYPALYLVTGLPTITLYLFFSTFQDKQWANFTLEIKYNVIMYNCTQFFTCYQVPLLMSKASPSIAKWGLYSQVYLSFHDLPLLCHGLHHLSSRDRRCPQSTFSAHYYTPYS